MEFLNKNDVLEKYGLRKDRNFKVDSQKDFVQKQVLEKTQQTVFKVKNISHPDFKNIGCQGAINYLAP